MDPSLFYLHHLRSRAATAHGARGGGSTRAGRVLPYQGGVGYLTPQARLFSTLAGLLAAWIGLESTLPGVGILLAAVVGGMCDDYYLARMGMAYPQDPLGGMSSGYALGGLLPGSPFGDGSSMFMLPSFPMPTVMVPRWSGSGVFPVALAQENYSGLPTGPALPMYPDLNGTGGPGADGGMLLVVTELHLIAMVSLPVLVMAMYAWLRLSYPNQVGPKRTHAIRRFFNTADILLGLTGVLGLGIATGAKVMTLGIAVGTAITLRKFEVHGPRNICFGLTWACYFGIFQAAVPDGNLLYLGAALVTAGLIALALRITGSLPFARRKEMYIQKLGPVRVGSRLKAQIDGPRAGAGQEVIGQVLRLGRRSATGVTASVRIETGPPEVLARFGANPIEIHLCAPEQPGECTGAKGKNAVHVKRKRWEVFAGPAPAPLAGAGAAAGGAAGGGGRAHPLAGRRPGERAAGPARRTQLARDPLLSLASGEELDPDFADATSGGAGTQPSGGAAADGDSDDDDDDDSDDDDDDEPPAAAALGTGAKNEILNAIHALGSRVGKIEKGSTAAGERKATKGQGQGSPGQRARKDELCACGLALEYCAACGRGSEQRKHGLEGLAPEAALRARLNPSQLYGNQQQQAPTRSGSRASGSNNDPFERDSAADQSFRAAPTRPDGFHLESAVQAARETTGVSEATLSLYVSIHRWTRCPELKPHAVLLAKALDMWLRGQALQAIDLLASRLKALVHVDLTGSWRTAEALQSETVRDQGLVGAKEVYEARRAAKVMTWGDISSSSAEEELVGPADPKAKAQAKPRKRGKRGKKKKKVPP